MNAVHCKMARVALGWSGRDLAEQAGLGYATVARFESGMSVDASSVHAMQRALESAGISFVDTGKWSGAVRPPVEST